MEELPKQRCGHCQKEVKPFPRYPRYLCRDCVAILADANGRKVAFFNTHIAGYGCQGYYQDTDPREVYEGNIAYIAGASYFAKEARFGGIVVQPIADQSRHVKK